MRHLFIITTILVNLFLVSNNLIAQEIKYNFTINTPRLFTAEPQTLEVLKKNLIEFLNNQKWTDEDIKDEEKINCNIQLNISKDKSPTEFEATMTILATRPVYASTYETVIFQYQDEKVNFIFEPGNIFTFTPNTFSNNLTSILAYYSYLIIGLDHDSFQDQGGEEMYDKAQDIVNVLPTGITQTDDAGWMVNSASKNNLTRYFLVENLKSKKLKDWRTGWYEYHRQGLDLASSDITNARKNILNALKLMEKSFDQYNNSLVISLMANVKSSEIVDIFRPADKADKDEVFRVLGKLYPSGRSNLIDLQR